MRGIQCHPPSIETLESGRSHPTCRHARFSGSLTLGLEASANDEAFTGRKTGKQQGLGLQDIFTNRSLHGGVHTKDTHHYVGRSFELGVHVKRGLYFLIPASMSLWLRINIPPFPPMD